jgi:hypothetical protein
MSKDRFRVSVFGRTEDFVVVPGPGEPILRIAHSFDALALALDKAIDVPEEPGAPARDLEASILKALKLKSYRTFEDSVRALCTATADGGPVVIASHKRSKEGRGFTAPGRTIDLAAGAKGPEVARAVIELMTEAER